jgi:hypothetical protein
LSYYLERLIIIMESGDLTTFDPEKDDKAAILAYEAEAQKNCDLQYYLVNAIRTINELEGQLKDARAEIKALKTDYEELKVENRGLKRKASQLSSDSDTRPSSASQEVRNNASSSVSSGASASEIGGGSTSNMSNSSSTEIMRPFNSKVERAIRHLAPTLINPDPNTRDTDLIGKFVARIFNGDIFYGYTIAQKNGLFQVVYSDGDTQKLGRNEVLLSLVDEGQIPRKSAEMCRDHYRRGTYKERTPLPTIS